MSYLLYTEIYPVQGQCGFCRTYLSLDWIHLKTLHEEQNPLSGKDAIHTVSLTETLTDGGNRECGRRQTALFLYQMCMCVRPFDRVQLWVWTGLLPRRTAAGGTSGLSTSRRRKLAGAPSAL